MYPASTRIKIITNVRKNFLNPEPLRLLSFFNSSIHGFYNKKFVPLIDINYTFVLNLQFVCKRE